MKIHKVDKTRVYFIMDSGACGSIARGDITKLCTVHNWLDNAKVDPRDGSCLTDVALAIVEQEIEGNNA